MQTKYLTLQIGSSLLEVIMIMKLMKIYKIQLGHIVSLILFHWEIDILTQCNLPLSQDKRVQRHATKFICTINEFERCFNFSIYPPSNEL